MRVFILFFVCLVTHFSWAQTQESLLQAQVSLSAEKVLLDQTVTIQLALMYPKGYRTDVDVLQEHLMRNSSISPFPFSLVEEPKGSRNQDQGMVHETIYFTLQPQIPGVHILSFLDIPLYKDMPSQELVEDLVSNMFQVEVNMPSSVLEEIRVAPPLSLSGKLPISLSHSNTLKTKKLFFSKNSLNKTVIEWQARKFPWEKIGMAILCVLGGLIAWVMIRDKRPAPLEARKKVRKSEQAFTCLKRADLLEKGQLSIFMEQLSLVLKKYLEEREGLQAGILTTDELAPHIASKEIQQFFLKVDLIKFAGYKPTLDECKQAEALVSACLKAV